MALSLFLLVAAISHEPWTELLKKFVTPQSRVDYGRLRREGLPQLDRYLDSLAKPWPREMTPLERKAALINAYNALTVRWVAAHYPIPSIWRTAHPFTEARHTVDGRKLSLDQIETELRAMGDPRVHSVLVCAARSCPPLRRHAYEADSLETQLDDNTSRWLAVAPLNEFNRQTGVAEVSQIFEWYRGDFESGGRTLIQFLSRYGPAPVRQVRFREYYWGINDAGTQGDSYGKASFYFDSFRNKYF